MHHQTGEAYNGVQRRTYFMAHIGEEGRFEPVGKFRFLFQLFQFLRHLFPFCIVELDTGIAGDVSFFISFHGDSRYNQRLPLILPFTFGTVLETEFFVCPLEHIFNIFANTVHIFRMCSLHVIVRSDGSFRMIVVDGIVEGFELSGRDVKIPVRHSDSLESKLHFVVSFFYFLVQLVKFGYILAETGEAYVVAIFILLKRYAQNVAVLP